MKSKRITYKSPTTLKEELFKESTKISRTQFERGFYKRTVACMQIRDKKLEKIKEEINKEMNVHNPLHKTPSKKSQASKSKKSPVVGSPSKVECQKKVIYIETELSPPVAYDKFEDQQQQATEKAASGEKPANKPRYGFLSAKATHSKRIVFPKSRTSMKKDLALALNSNSPDSNPVPISEFKIFDSQVSEKKEHPKGIQKDRLKIIDQLIDQQIQLLRDEIEEEKKEAVLVGNVLDELGPLEPVIHDKEDEIKGGFDELDDTHQNSITIEIKDSEDEFNKVSKLIDSPIKKARIKLIHPAEEKSNSTTRLKQEKKDIFYFYKGNPKSTKK